MTDEVDRRLTFALERVGQALRTLLRTAAAAESLTPVQAQLLLRLRAAPADQRAVTPLARWADITQPTVSDAVAALVRKGLVARRGDPRDGRATRLVPTAAGRAAARRLDGWDEPVRDALAASLSPAERAEFAGRLPVLLGALHRAGVLSVARTCPTCQHFRPEAHPGTAEPAHCALLDAPLGPATFRLDCPDHQPAA
ncbi:MarR family winged helix-turn-helix transcriptional regulator [Actinophytocola sp.]|uniref:MarR family winged helix-turn-helix transcriptional regulator n=1 Tax=Actinophytocola sp. TaxID=1872138 RepID=UPI003D6A847E